MDVLDVHSTINGWTCYSADLHVQLQALWTTVHQDGLIWLVPSRLPGLLQRGPMGCSCNIISSSPAMMAEESLLLRVWGTVLYLVNWTTVNCVSCSYDINVVVGEWENALLSWSLLKKLLILVKMQLNRNTVILKQWGQYGKPRKYYIPVIEGVSLPF